LTTLWQADVQLMIWAIHEQSGRESPLTVKAPCLAQSSLSEADARDDVKEHLCLSTVEAAAFCDVILGVRTGMLRHAFVRAV
jgi:hypothetical protein